MRIIHHPILTFEHKKEIPFVFEGKELIGYEGDTIASALIDHGIVTFGYSIKRNRNRGFYCAIGNCAACNMIVDGIPNIRTCITPLKANMVITRQPNKGEYR